MSDLFAEQNGDILVLGLGDAGGRVAGAGCDNASHPESPLRVSWAAAHERPAALIATGLEQKVLFNSSEGPFARKRAAQYVAMRETELLRLAAGKSVVIIAGALDEQTVRVFLPAIAEALQRSSDLLVCAVGCDPSGKANASQELEDTCHLLIQPSVDKLAREFRDRPQQEFQKALEHRLLQAIETLSGALCGSSITPAALRGALRGNGALYAGIGVARGPEAILESVEAALADSSAGRMEYSGLLAAVAAPRPLTVSETGRIHERLRAWGSIDGRVLLGSSVQFCPVADAVALVLCRQASGNKVISIDSFENNHFSTMKSLV